MKMILRFLRAVYEVLFMGSRGRYKITDEICQHGEAFWKKIRRAG